MSRVYFNENQLDIIEQGKDLGFNRDQQQVYINPKFTSEQMYEIQQGFIDGLSIPKVKEYADETFSTKEMYNKRKELVSLLDTKVDRDSLFDDINVRKVFDVLKENGREKEAANFHTVIAQVDILAASVDKQMEELKKLEVQVQELKKPSIREKVAGILDTAKTELLELKDILGKIKNRIKERCSYLMETFKISGMFAFYKVFEGFTHELKEILQNAEKSNYYRADRITERIMKLESIREEAESIGTGIRNIGRLIIGRHAIFPEDDRHIRGILSSCIHVLENVKMSQKLDASFYKRGAKALNSLENSFKEKAKDTKKDLNSLIRGAALRNSIKEKAKEKESERTR